MPRIKEIRLEEKCCCGEDLYKKIEELNPFPGELDSESTRETKICKKCGYEELIFSNLFEPRYIGPKYQK